MNELQAAYVEVANTRYNGKYKHFNEIPADLKATIARKHNFSHLSGESVLQSMPGESIADKLYEWKRSDAAAKRDVEQRLELESPTRQKSAKELRVEYLQGKRVDPLNRKHHERQLAEAIRELKEEQAEQAAEAKIAETRQAIESNARYANAVENAEATLRLAGTTEEKTEAMIQLKLLQSVSDPSDIERRVSNYWEAERVRREKEVLREMENANQTAKAASEAVKADTEQETRILDAQRQADTARRLAEGNDD